MGVAIIVPGVSFADANLGKVTISGDVPVQALTIIAEDSYIGTSAQLSVSYLPITTTQRSVVWSIVSGSEYATINETSGKITILNGAKNASVTVKATSASNQSISATKSLSVTYAGDMPTPFFSVNKHFDGNEVIDSGFKPFSANSKNWTMFVEVNGESAEETFAFGLQYLINNQWYGMQSSSKTPFTFTEYSRITKKTDNKYAIKMDDGLMSYTNDGETWSDLVDWKSSQYAYYNEESMPIGDLNNNGALFGLKFIGNLNLKVWKDSEIDVKALF